MQPSWTDGKQLQPLLPRDASDVEQRRPIVRTCQLSRSAGSPAGENSAVSTPRGHTSTRRGSPSPDEQLARVLGRRQHARRMPYGQRMYSRISAPRRGDPLSSDVYAARSV